MIAQHLVSFMQTEGGQIVLCRNNTPLKTPQNAPFAVPTQRLAERIVEEFAAHHEKMDVRKMPYTQLALTTIDITLSRRDEVEDNIIRYGETELLCQRATDPADLVSRQDTLWDPYLSWCRERFGAEFKTGHGIIPFDQNPEAIKAVRGFIKNLDPFSLTGLGEICATTGSLILSLALIEKHASVEETFCAAELDQLWQTEKWGEDPATQNRHAELKQSLSTCETWFSLLEK